MRWQKDGDRNIARIFGLHADWRDLQARDWPLGPLCFESPQSTQGAIPFRSPAGPVEVSRGELAKGYEYQYLWAEGAQHVEGGVERQTMLEAVEWVWKTYKGK